MSFVIRINHISLFVPAQDSPNTFKIEWTSIARSLQIWHNRQLFQRLAQLGRQSALLTENIRQIVEKALRTDTIWKNLTNDNVRISNDGQRQPRRAQHAASLARASLPTSPSSGGRHVRRLGFIGLRGKRRHGDCDVARTEKDDEDKEERVRGRAEGSGFGGC